jgi:hypothetical protein
MEEDGDDVYECESDSEESKPSVWMRLLRIAELQLGCCVVSL